MPWSHRVVWEPRARALEPASRMDIRTRCLRSFLVSDATVTTPLQRRFDPLIRASSTAQVRQPAPSSFR